MRNAIDITLIAVYLIGTVIFGCSFFWKKKRRGSGADAQQRVPPGETEVDAEKEFVTGGGRLPTWAVSLSVFATLVSSISFLCFPAGAYGAEQWKGWVNSIALPFATVIAMIWFVPFYRKSTSASAYSFLEERYGIWARIYASVCFLILQNARPGIILLLTGIATMLYSMMGGFAAVVWADAIQSILLIVGTVVAVVFIVALTPDFGTHLAAAWDAGKFSLGSLSLTNWVDSTFWVLFLCNICLNLQNFGIDQCYTQRYAAAKDLKAARTSIWTSSWMYSGITLLFTLIGTLLWMFNRANPGVIPVPVVHRQQAAAGHFGSPHGRDHRGGDEHDRGDAQLRCHGHAGGLLEALRAEARQSPQQRPLSPRDDRGPRALLRRHRARGRPGGSCRACSRAACWGFSSSPSSRASRGPGTRRSR